MLSHNVLGVKGWTIKFWPWELLFQETYDSKTEAMRREKELKTAAGIFIGYLALQNRSRVSGKVVYQFETVEPHRNIDT